jgi:hypothetical protein
MRWLLLVLVCFTVGCGSLGTILKHEAERSIKKDVGEVLDEQFPTRFRAELDKEIPPDVRSTARVLGKHLGKVIAGLLATLAAKYGIQVELQKRTIAKNGNGNTKSTDKSS